ncbi:MAG: transposase, partial [Methylocella sp.]
PELGTLGRREIAALAGLAPWTRQSGAWRGKSFIGGGRSSVRAALFMGGGSFVTKGSGGELVAARHNPALNAFKQRLIDASKPKLVAIIAVARKLLTISLVRLSRWSELRLGSVSRRAFPTLNAMLRDAKPWQEIGEKELAHAKA